MITIAAFLMSCEIIIELTINSVTWLATTILDNRFLLPADNTVNIIQKFADYIPFNIDIAGVIRGIAFGVLLLILLVSLVKSISAPFTGESAPNPWQVCIRFVLTIVLINLIFGTNFLTNGNGQTFLSQGLIAKFGEWFSVILSKLNNEELSVQFAWSGINPAHTLVVLIMCISLLTSIIGAALTHIERIISFGLYVILGPIAVAMNACQETAETFKQWVIGVFAQFMAIFLSLVLWQSFKLCLVNCFSNSSFIDGISLFDMAITMALLGIVKNSEKILNAFGIRTMANMESARMFAGGFATLASTTMIASRLVGFAGRSKSIGGLGTSGQPSLYTNGGLNTFKSQFQNAQGKTTFGSAVKGLFNADTHPFKTASNLKQYKAASELHGIIDGNHFLAPDETIQGASADMVNKGFGLKEGKSSLYATGDANGNMAYASAKSISGNNVEGFMGDATYVHDGQKEMLNDAFFVVNGENETLSPGTFIGVDAQGNERFIDPNSSGPVIDNAGNQVYRTVTENGTNYNVEYNSTINTDENNVSFNNLGETTIAENPISNPVVNAQEPIEEMSAEFPINDSSDVSEDDLSFDDINIGTNNDDDK